MTDSLFDDSCTDTRGQALQRTPVHLTDYEISALKQRVTLADGHAYQDSHPGFKRIIQDLPTLWELCERTSIPDLEHRFRDAFAELAKSPRMRELPFFKVCPTASNSIDIVGALLAERRIVTRLIEPTFDNIPLLLRRRGVPLLPLAEGTAISTTEEMCLPEHLSNNPCGALFLVQPNNPTGICLDARSLSEIAQHCCNHGTTLVLDNSFRFYNRDSFDDYAILSTAGVSFIAFEDTGKVWPTHDLKASLLFCSQDFEESITTIYNELFLCTSRFSLALLEQFVLTTRALGLAETIWSTVDIRRQKIRQCIQGTRLRVDPTALHSMISVEWLECRETSLTDLDVTEVLADRGLYILPGRQFFWNSGHRDDRHFNIRLSLLKPRDSFDEAMNILRAFGQEMRYH